MILRAILAVAYATGRAFLARQFKGIHWFSMWGFGVGLTTPHSKKLIATKVEKRKIW